MGEELTWEEAYWQRAGATAEGLEAERKRRAGLVAQAMASASRRNWTPRDPPRRVKSPPNKSLRRNNVELNTPEERAIRDVSHAVDALGAHPRLTDAIVSLTQAREALADWVDEWPEGRGVPRV